MVLMLHVDVLEALSRLGKKPIFISAIGGDALGAVMLKHCQDSNMVSSNSLPPP